MEKRKAETPNLPLVPFGWQKSVCKFSPRLSEQACLRDLPDELLLQILSHFVTAKSGQEAGWQHAIR